MAGKTERYFRNFSVIVIKMQIEDGAGKKVKENSGRNEEKQLKYLQGVLQRRWILMMFYCLFRDVDTRRDDGRDVIMITPR